LTKLQANRKVVYRSNQQALQINYY